jgi:membrane-associated phospholipid phosphatase
MRCHLNHFVASAFVLLASGCSTLPSGEGWGASATIAPGWERVKAAAVQAAKDPWVWGPLAGAAAFQIDNFDRRTSDWARDHTPVFGSEQNATDWSDHLRSVCVAAQLGTLLATPSGNNAGEWITNKLKGEVVEVAAIGATGLATNELKSATGRERPNGTDTESFPSGHSSSAAVHSELAIYNLESVEMSPGWETTAEVGIRAAAFGTAWARVEGGWHYPSDTLAGMALGNFLASFATHAFMGDPSKSLSLSMTDGGAMVQWQFSF